MIPGLLALALASAQPCATPLASLPADTATAALYRETGDTELAAGHPTTAAVAYRKAAALDPADDASRAAWQRLCAASPAPVDPFEEGNRLMEAGDLRAAAAAFERGRQRGDRAAALLEGVCRYRLGEDAAAESAFREAEHAPEHADLARFYLGLLALRAGRPGQAAGYFESTASNPELRDMSATLARLAHRDGRLVLSFEVGSGYDSNVALLPRGSTSSSGGMMGGATPSGMPDGDGFLDLAGAALWRPSGPVGPYLRAGALFHGYANHRAYDLGAVEAAGGWQYARDGHGLLGELGYGSQAYGGSTYLQAGRILASGWFTSGDWTWSATWAGSRQAYAPAYQGFDGNLQRLELKAAWTLGAQTWLGLAYDASRDSASASTASYVEHGPRAELRAVLSPSWRLGLDGAVLFRSYAAFDAALGVQRADTYLAGAAFGECDLSDRWTLRLSVEAKDAASNAPAAEYAKLVGMAALIYAFGM